MDKIPSTSKLGKKYYRKPTTAELNAFERQWQVKEMREVGHTFKEIGVRLSISTAGAARLYKKSQRDYLEGILIGSTLPDEVYIYTTTGGPKIARGPKHGSRATVKYIRAPLK